MTALRGCGNAVCRDSIGDVFDHHAARTDNTPRTDLDSGDGAGTDTNECAFADVDIAAQVDTGSNMNVVPYHTIMVYSATRVQDDVSPYPGPCVNGNLRHNHCAFSDNGGSRDDSRYIDGGSVVRETRRKSLSGSVVTNAQDESPVKTRCVIQFAKHRVAVHLAYRMVVQKT